MNAKVWLQRFNKIRILVDIVLFLTFFAIGIVGLNFFLPMSIIVDKMINTVTTVGILIWAFSWLKLAEYASGLMKLEIEKVVESQKTEEERAAPIIINKKSISVANIPDVPTLSNKVIKTTKVILDSNTNFVQKRSKVKTKKEG